MRGRAGTEKDKKHLKKKIIYAQRESMTKWREMTAQHRIYEGRDVPLQQVVLLRSDLNLQRRRRHGQLPATRQIPPR